MKFNLGEVLTKAWNITWKFKVLWIFGILAGCAGGNGNRFNFNFNRNDFTPNGGSGQMPDIFRQFENMQPERALQQILGQYGAIIAVVIALLCVLWLLFYFLGMMGKIGLIKGTYKADDGAEKLSFGELWTEGGAYFWRMFGLNLLVGLPFFLVFVILMVGLGFAGFGMLRSGTSDGGIAAALVGLLGIFFAVICVISLVSLVVGMIVEQAQNAVVLEDLGVLEGLGRGWAVFKSGWLTIVVLAIILAIMSGVIGLIIALPLVAILVPAGIGMAVSGTDNYILPLMIGGGCFLLYMPVLIVLSGILQSYLQSVWTLAYRRLTAKPSSTVVVEAGA
jgi:hypothetical protein